MPRIAVCSLLWLAGLLASAPGAVGGQSHNASREAAPAAEPPGASHAQGASQAREGSLQPPPPNACPNSPDVVVHAAAARDVEWVCEGAQRALAFLAKHRVAGPPNIRVDLVEELPGELGGRAVGCYLPATGRVMLLSYAAFEAGGEWFQVPVSPELYRAAAAHEIAHAAVGCHTAPQRLPVAAHEYLAYVVMFATLEAGLRERVLRRFPGRGFANTLQINDLNHIVNPNQYGVDAWRHYQRKADQSAWLQEVLRGEVVQEWPRDGP